MEPTTKMQKLDAQNPGLLTMLNGYLGQRKRPSWIAGKLSSRFPVNVNIMDVVDYIGERAGIPRKTEIEGEGPSVEQGTQSEVAFDPAGDSRPPALPPRVESRESLPMCSLLSTAYPPGAEGELGAGLPVPGSPLPASLLASAIPKAKPPRRAAIAPRKRRKTLLDLQVALVERLLESKKAGEDGLRELAPSPLPCPSEIGDSGLGIRGSQTKRIANGE